MHEAVNVRYVHLAQSKNRPRGNTTGGSVCYAIAAVRFTFGALAGETETREVERNRYFVWADATTFMEYGMKALAYGPGGHHQGRFVPDVRCARRSLQSRELARL